MSETWTVDPVAHADGTVFILEGADGDDVGIVAQISPALPRDKTAPWLIRFAKDTRP